MTARRPSSPRDPEEEEGEPRDGSTVRGVGPFVFKVMERPVEEDPVALPRARCSPQISRGREAATSDADNVVWGAASSSSRHDEEGGSVAERPYPLQGGLASTAELGEPRAALWMGLSVSRRGERRISREGEEFEGARADRGELEAAASDEESTIVAAFFSRTVGVNDASVKIEIWDTAGQERYHSLAPMYYGGAAAAIIVYGIASTV
ncbi:hypothetical protein NL676_005680 [Syzygium grande]|nr:hypothetical protein NL676_005680 [Syzygium grande]